MDEVKDKKKNSIGSNLVTLALIGTVAVVGISKTVKLCSNYMKRPHYGFNTYSSSITFYDDLPMGMRAFAIYDGNEVELDYKNKRELRDDKRREFIIPSEVLNSEKVIFYALDKHNRKSKSKTLYILDGIMTEKKPY